MKTLTLMAPLGSLVIAGHKKIETRSWLTFHRGRIAIHQGLEWHPLGKKLWKDRPWFRRLIRQCGFELAADVPLGAVLGTVNLTDCTEMTNSNIAEVHSIERCFGIYEPGRFMWRLEDPAEYLRPIPVRGRQGIWEWNGKSEQE